MLNKENINFSANAKSDKFLWKNVLQNVLSLYNSKKAFLETTGSILYNNYYLIVGSHPDIYYLVKLLTKKSVFHKQLKRNLSKIELLNLFGNSSISLLREILHTDYINSFWGK